MAVLIDLLFELWTWVGRRKHEFNRIRQIGSVCTISIVFARWCQCTRRHCRELCKNGQTDRFAVWVVDLGGPTEAQVELHSPGGANVPSHVGTLAPPREYD